MAKTAQIQNAKQAAGRFSPDLVDLTQAPGIHASWRPLVLSAEACPEQALWACPCPKPQQALEGARMRVYLATQRHILILQVHYYNNYLRDPKRPQMAEAPTGKPQGRRDGPHGRGPPNEQ